MKQGEFRKKVQELFREHEKLITRKNAKAKTGNGVYDRYANPVLTAEHTPLFWRYDFDYQNNPHLMERIGVNATFNAGAMEYEQKCPVFARVEGADRKSFLAVAESPNGVDNFRFWDYPIVMPETNEPDTNVYDIRVVRHEDGWILRAVLQGAERSEGATMGYPGGGAMRDCTHKGLEELGTVAGAADEIALAEERGAASGICGGEIRAVHAAAG
jgi:hypothetical protein